MINSFKGEYSWLSNMHDCVVFLRQHRFKSVENAYMAAKKIDDIKGWVEFCLQNPPNICKKESRNIEVRKDWDDIKLSVMYDLLIQKFSQEPFRTKLLDTGNENIQEGNYWNDTFWGVDLKQNPNVGENNLGRLIMYIRILLKQGRL